MRILILTQKIDQNDDLLGFMHGWVKEFANRCEQVTAICLGAGSYDLPQNVKVLSLGKEKGASRLKYIFNFYKHIWRERRQYDYIFVHMNCEYVLFGGLLWRLLGKKVILWYAHYLIDWRIKLAALLSHRVVTSTSFACKLKSVKLMVVGQGIDTEYFRDLSDYVFGGQINFLFLGRISPVKDLETLIRAVGLARQQSGGIYLTIVGAPTPADEKYSDGIKNLVEELGLSEVVKFWGKVSNRETLKFYNKNDIFINLTRTGSFDKTTLEAMACERPVLVCNRSFCDIFPPDLADKLIFKEKDSEELAKRILWLAGIDRQERQEIGRRLREIIVKEHSLKRLVAKLLEIFNLIDLK
ncbi:MAG: glycosyltransferase family 4 protein [bacterium]